MKYWERIADNLSKAGWSWGCVSAVDFKGRTIFVADAHRGEGKRFVVRADEKLSAFLELESAIHASESRGIDLSDKIYAQEAMGLGDTTSWRKGLSRAGTNIPGRHRRI